MSSKRNVIFGAGGIVLCALVVVAAVVYYKLTLRYSGEAVRIYVPAMASESDLRDSLVSNLGDFGSDVYQIWKLYDSEVSRAHGSYVVEPGTKAIALSRRLRSGNQSPVKITFNNIRTMDALAEKLADRMEWGATDFLSACDSVLPAKGFNPSQYPAAFLPDTYEFYWTTSAMDVVRRLSGIRDAYWNDERRSAAANLGLTPVQVATLASIVEEETAKADERGKVARLYLNRLSKGMLLQADPTVKYAVGDFSLRRILGRHLAADSPYNTYKYAGLPPGPIRIADRRTLDAVLDAPQHNYIYMCAKEDFSGYHNFASDYAAHNENARRYRRELDRRNIK